MAARVDPKAAERTMRDVGLKPLEPFPGAGKPWRCRCLTCGQEVSPTLGTARKGSGCRYCGRVKAANAKRVPNKDAHSVMTAAGLVALAPYPGINEPWRCRCKECGREVTPTLANVRKGQGGCRYCADTKRAAARTVPAKEARAIMVAAGLNPQVPYPGAHAPWLSKCKICGHEVSPNLTAIKSGRGGCRYCGIQRRSRARTVPGPVAVKEMRAAGFKPLTPYPGRVTAPWPCRCKTCGSEVSPTLDRVRRGGGCGACKGNTRVTQAQAIAEMRAAHLEPHGSYRGIDVAWPCTCNICHREVSPTLARIRSGGACRFCGRRKAAEALRLTEAAATKVMKAARLKPKVLYPGNHKAWLCECMDCGNEVSPMYGNIAKGQGGCQHCADHGFRPGEPALVYLLTDPNRGAHKIGIAGIDSGRLDKHRRAGWTVHRTREVASGKVAYEVEAAVLRWWRDDLGHPPFLATGDGWTETVDASVLDAKVIWAYVGRVARRIDPANASRRTI